MILEISWLQYMQSKIELESYTALITTRLFWAITEALGLKPTCSAMLGLRHTNLLLKTSNDFQWEAQEVILDSAY